MITPEQNKKVILKLANAIRLAKLKFADKEFYEYVEEGKKNIEKHIAQLERELTETKDILKEVNDLLGAKNFEMKDSTKTILDSMSDKKSIKDLTPQDKEVILKAFLTKAYLKNQK